MSRVQRIVFAAIAVVIAVVAVILITTVGTSGGSSSTASAPTAAPTEVPQEASPAETETATPEPTPTPDPVKTLEAGKLTKLSVKEGDTVKFRVRSDVPEEIHVHGYDRYVDVTPGKAATESFKATITGVFEIEFHGSGEEIARLTVEP